VLSHDPADQLILELIATRRPATAEERAAIVARMASVPFDERDVAVSPEHRLFTYANRQLGPRASSVVYHLVKRVIVDRQWAAAMTTAEYLTDLRSAILSPRARLAIYSRRGGTIAATLTATTLVIPEARLGQDSLDELLVVYSVDRGVLITGYQCSSLATTGIPSEALWLK
jgi:hypothetical protein